MFILAYPQYIQRGLFYKKLRAFSIFLSDDFTIGTALQNNMLQSIIPAAFTNDVCIYDTTLFGLKCKQLQNNFIQYSTLAIISYDICAALACEYAIDFLTYSCLFVIDLDFVAGIACFEFLTFILGGLPSCIQFTLFCDFIYINSQTFIFLLGGLGGLPGLARTTILFGGERVAIIYCANIVNFVFFTVMQTYTFYATSACYTLHTHTSTAFDYLTASAVSVGLLDGATCESYLLSCVFSEGINFIFYINETIVAYSSELAMNVLEQGLSFLNVLYFGTLAYNF